MNLRPTYVFDTMQSKGINGINTGRMILVGESLENNTGIFIVNKDTTALTANTTIQQALDGGYLKMLQKKTTEKFGEYEFDNISNSNPVMSSGLTLGKTWLNQTTGEIFITATVNGVTGWKGNKGTSIFRKPVPELQGYVNTSYDVGNYTSIMKKDFQILYFQIWDITNNKLISSTYNSVCLEKNAKYVKDYKWILTNFPLPFPKWGDVEERKLATEYKAKGITLATLITGVSNIENQGKNVSTVCSAVDYLINFKYFGSNASEEDYVGLDLLSEKSNPSLNPPDVIISFFLNGCILDGEGMKRANNTFPNGGTRIDVNFIGSMNSINEVRGEAFHTGVKCFYNNQIRSSNYIYFRAIVKSFNDEILKNPSKIWFLTSDRPILNEITKSNYMSSNWVW